MKTEKRIESYDSVPRKGISWRAIFAGIVTIIAVMLVLNLIGLAVGLGSIEPTEESNPLSGLGTGALIWWIVSSLIALFLGGFVAARVGVSFSNKSGIIQGIMTWALYTFISAWLLTSAVGSIISGVGNLVGNVLSTTGQAIGNQVGPIIQEQAEQLDISLEDAKQEFYALLEDTQKEDLDPDELEARANQVGAQAEDRAETAARRPGRIDAELEGIFNDARNQFEDSFEEIDKEALVNILVERTDMSESEARRTVDNYLAQYENLREQANQALENAKEQANQTAENVAGAVADAALYLSIALILGAIVSAAGGFTGVKNLRDDYSETHYVHEDSNYSNERETRRTGHVTRPGRDSGNVRHRDNDPDVS